MNREIKGILSSLRAEDREFIRNLPEERLILLHRTLGRQLRNGFRSGKYKFLFSHCYQQEPDGTRSLDSMSSTAIKLIWSYLHDRRPAVVNRP